MKNVLLFAGAIFLMGSLFAQETPRDKNAEGLTKEDYLRKSKGQKTGAIVLISGGGALTIVGFALAMDDLENSFDGLFDPNYKPEEKNETVSEVLVITGLAAMLGSIPLFISAHKNKQRAMSISFKNQLAPQLQGNLISYKSVPNISLVIHL